MNIEISPVTLDDEALIQRLMELKGSVQFFDNNSR
jgi:hypothetical protein